MVKDNAAARGRGASVERAALVSLLALVMSACAEKQSADSPRIAEAPDQGSPIATGAIDREALVTRHNVRLDAIDPEAPVMVGNGNLAMALDITGLQTFRDQYSDFSPLLTEAQWAWHSFPNSDNLTIEDAYRPITAHGKTYAYPYFSDWAQAAENPAISYLRSNPHRCSLGRLSFTFKAEDVAAPLDFEAVENPRQTLDLWTGRAASEFTVKGEPVSVATSILPGRDMVIVEVTSPLVASGELGVEIAFPYVSEQLNPDPAEWNAPDKHNTELEMNIRPFSAASSTMRPISPARFSGARRVLGRHSRIISSLKRKKEATR